MYHYIQIGHDNGFSQSLSRLRIENTLRTLPELMPDMHHGFKNADNMPWLRINIGTCDANGNYSNASLADKANMVELICLDRGDPSARNLYQNLVARIASLLSWTIVSPE